MSLLVLLNSYLISSRLIFFFLSVVFSFLTAKYQYTDANSFCFLKLS